MLLIDRATSHLEPVLVQPRQLDLLYHVEHWRQYLIILANTGPGQEYQVEFVQYTPTDTHCSWVAHILQEECKYLISMSMILL